MSLNNPVMGEGYIPAYQISSSPWLTSSQISLGQIQALTFPQVTRFINVQNVALTGSDKIALAFTSLGFTTGNFFTLTQSSSFREEIRTDRLFISCSAGTNVNFQVAAGLTGIPARQFLTITGSNGFQGVG
jgi:hypothetical protein